MSVTPNIDTKALRELEAKATKGPWRWTAGDGDPQIEGNVEYPEASPVLVTSGCRNEHRTSIGIQGCMPEKLNDQLRACPMHPHANDRELIVALRNAAPALLDLADRAQELERDVARADAIALTASKDANELEAERDTLRDVGAALNREVEELRSERDALKAEMEQYKGFYESMLIRAREFQDERNALKAEVERLRSGMEVVARIKNELHAHNADIRAANGALQSKLSTSEREAERLRAALDGMLGQFEYSAPDANCSCHIAPPCSDCVEWGGAREAVERARAALRGEEAPRGE